MGAASRRKGVGFERFVGAYLRERGFEAERRDQTRQDHGWPDLVTSYDGEPLSLECKCVEGMPAAKDLAALEQVEGASRAEGLRAAILKVRGEKVSESVVLLRLRDFAELFKRASQEKAARDLDRRVKREIADHAKFNDDPYDHGGAYRG